MSIGTPSITKSPDFRALVYPFFLSLIAAGCSDPAASRPAGSGTGAPSSKTIQLIIDYGDGVQKRFTSIAWSDSMTVLDALQSADEHPRGIELEIRGSGEVALVTRIDDLENGRSEPPAYWTYEVNEKKADRSAGAYELQAGDVVKWRYGVYNPEEATADK